MSSPEFHQLCDIATKHNVFLSVGIIEKDGGTLYCTAVLIDRMGALLYAHRKVRQLVPNSDSADIRKLIPTAAERLVWGRGAGDGLKVVDTTIGKVGGLICWENYMPAARLSLYQQGIEYGINLTLQACRRILTDILHRIYIAPNADDLPSWVASMQHIAKEGRCFVISVNQFCKVSDFPSDYPPFTPEHHDRQPHGSQWLPESILSHGGSCVIGPLGTFITEPVWDREDIVFATLNLDDLVEAKVCRKASAPSK